MATNLAHDPVTGLQAVAAAAMARTPIVRRPAPCHGAPRARRARGADGMTCLPASLRIPYGVDAEIFRFRGEELLRPRSRNVVYDTCGCSCQ